MNETEQYIAAKQNVSQFIRLNELQWWHLKLPKKAVRELINKECGLKIKAKDFGAFLDRHTQIYGHWRRKPESSAKVLSSDQWDKLKYTVELRKAHIKGVGISLAYDIVRVEVSTNVSQLLGLPKRMHYWN